MSCSYTELSNHRIERLRVFRIKSAFTLLGKLFSMFLRAKTYFHVKNKNVHVSPETKRNSDDVPSHMKNNELRS